MKKFFAVLAIAALSMSAFAQEEEALYSVKTNSFWSNWFVSANYAYSAAYSSQEANLDLAKSPFESFRANHGFSVALGKWHTPGLGLRVKFNGIQGKQVNSETKNGIDQWHAQADALFNVTNMIWGYKQNRVYNFIPYAGFGAIRDCSDNAYAKAFDFGILNTFRINDIVSVNFELTATLADQEADGNAKCTKQHSIKGQDKLFGAELGLTFNLGKKGWKKAVDEDALRAEYDAQIAGLNSQLADANAEIARLKDELAKKPKEIVKKEVEKVGVAVPQSIFFNCGSAKVTSKKETVNLQAIAEAAKANSDLKVYVTGYADSATGSASLNQALSEKRAATVASQLEELGVSRSQMVVEGKGGVADLNPTSHNRRVVVECK